MAREININNNATVDLCLSAQAVVVQKKSLETTVSPAERNLFPSVRLSFFFRVDVSRVSCVVVST
jgi:hypothetical protein